MLGYSIVNTKGQVTIPAPMRKKLGIHPGKKVVLFREDDRVSVAPVGDFRSLRGIVPARETPANFKRLRKEFIEYLGTRKHL